jgi:hypothetical protein
MIAIPFLGVACLIAAVFIHPLFVFLLALPFISARVYSINVLDAVNSITAIRGSRLMRDHHESDWDFSETVF